MKPIYEISPNAPNTENIAPHIGNGCTRRAMRSSVPNALLGMIDIGAVIPADNRIVG